MNEDLVFCYIVGGLEVKSNNVLQAVSLWEMRTTPVPAPVTMSKPSKYII